MSDASKPSFVITPLAFFRSTLLRKKADGYCLQNPRLRRTAALQVNNSYPGFDPDLIGVGTKKSFAPPSEPNRRLSRILCGRPRRVLARHREGPVADGRERFLVHCAEQGLAHESLLLTAREILIVAKHIDLTTGKAISVHELEAAADCWSAHQQRRDRLRGSDLDGSRQLFIQKALAWLRFLGRLEEPGNKANPFGDLLKDFAAYMREDQAG